MRYCDFYLSVRRRLKDELDGNPIGYKFATKHIEDATLQTLRTLYTTFPEIRQTIKGRRIDIPSEVKDYGSIEDVPIPPEFEPALFAGVMRSCHESDSNDLKDNSLATYWSRRFQELAGV